MPGGAVKPSPEQGTRVPEVNQVTAVHDGPARAARWRTIPGWAVVGLGALLYADDARHRKRDRPRHSSSSASRGR